MSFFYRIRYTFRSTFKLNHRKFCQKLGSDDVKRFGIKRLDLTLTLATGLTIFAANMYSVKSYLCKSEKDMFIFGGKIIIATTHALIKSLYFGIVFPLTWVVVGVRLHAAYREKDVKYALPPFVLGSLCTLNAKNEYKNGMDTKYLNFPPQLQESSRLYTVKESY